MTERRRSLVRYRVVHPATPRAAIGVSGVLASLLIHGLLLMPLVLGGHRHRQPSTPNTEGASARPRDQKSPESMQVVFVDEESRTIRDSSQDPDMNRFLLPPPRLSPIARRHIQTAALGSIEKPDDQTVVEAQGDQAGRALLFGRYMGQISARIERAWLRPRSVPSDVAKGDSAESTHPGAFSCRVQITQDQH